MSLNLVNADVPDFASSAHFYRFLFRSCPNITSSSLLGTYADPLLLGLHEQDDAWPNLGAPILDYASPKHLHNFLQGSRLGPVQSLTLTSALRDEVQKSEFADTQWWFSSEELEPEVPLHIMQHIWYAELNPIR